jgi:hypothetical protein
VTWKLRDAEQREALYDPELTTYSVAAHVVAYATGVNRIRDNLALTHKLADIALNLTDGGFSGLRVTSGIPETSGFAGFAKVGTAATPSAASPSASASMWVAAKSVERKSSWH